MWEYLTSEVMWHKNCRRQVLHLTYQPSRFNEFGNDTNGYNINSNNNDSSNINEVIRAVLNFLFFYEKILQAPKSTKKYQKHKKAQKSPKKTKSTKNTKMQPSKNTKPPISKQKLKMCLKNIWVEKSNLFAHLLFCSCEEKKIEKLVYWDRLKN